MSRITNKEPNHWHDANGHHRMPDPRRYYGEKWKNKTGNWTSADERAYVEHLITHEQAEVNPVRRDDDSKEVQNLFDYIELHEEMNAKARRLIAAIRDKEEKEASRDASESSA